MPFDCSVLPLCPNTIIWQNSKYSPISQNLTKSQNVCRPQKGANLAVFFKLDYKFWYFSFDTKQANPFPSHLKIKCWYGLSFLIVFSIQTSDHISIKCKFSKHIYPCKSNFVKFCEILEVLYLPVTNSLPHWPITSSLNMTTI